MDSSQKIVWRSGRQITLTAKEFSILELLIENKNKVLPRLYIAEKIGGINYGKFTNIIDVNINNLRLKIDKDSDFPLIHTIIGMGYVLKAG